MSGLLSPILEWPWHWDLQGMRSWRLSSKMCRKPLFGCGKPWMILGRNRHAFQVGAVWSKWLHQEFIIQFCYILSRLFWVFDDAFQWFQAIQVHKFSKFQWPDLGCEFLCVLVWYRLFVPNNHWVVYLEPSSCWCYCNLVCGPRSSKMLWGHKT